MRRASSYWPKASFGTLLFQGKAQLVVDVARFRIEAQGLLVMANGLVGSALGLQDVGEGAVAQGKTGVDAHRSLETGQGLVLPSLAIQSDAEVVVGDGRVRLQRQRHSQESDGDSRLPLLHEGRAEPEVGVEVARVLLFTCRRNGVALPPAFSRHSPRAKRSCTDCPLVGAVRVKSVSFARSPTPPGRGRGRARNRGPPAGRQSAANPAAACRRCRSPSRRAPPQRRPRRRMVGPVGDDPSVLLGVPRPAERNTSA